MSAEGQRFGRSAEMDYLESGGGRPAERLTHAEQAHRLIDLSSGVWDSGTTSHLDVAAKIERVARAVVKRHVMPAYCSESDCAICRLRALVQPPAVGEDDGA